MLQVSRRSCRRGRPSLACSPGGCKQASFPPQAPQLYPRAVNQLLHIEAVQAKKTLHDLPRICFPSSLVILPAALGQRA